MSNPFEQSDYDQGASGGGYSTAQSPEYNPFAAGGAATSTAAVTSNTNKPTTTATTTASPFSGGGGGGGGGNSEEIKMREAALAKRAAELDEKERQLKRREAELGAAGWKPPNWPPCKPMVYHDIKEEIPTELQSMVRAGYFNWIGYSVSMFLNWFGVMCYFFALNSNKPSGFIAGCFLLLLGPPMAWMMSYKSLYSGAQTGKSSPLLWYVLTQACTVFMCLFLFLGIPDTGGGGIFLLVSAAAGTGKNDKKNPFVTAVLGIVTACWGVMIFYGVYCMKRVWYYYKIAGGSGKTEEEIRSEMAKQAIKTGAQK